MTALSTDLMEKCKIIWTRSIFLIFVVPVGCTRKGTEAVAAIAPYCSGDAAAAF